MEVDLASNVKSLAMGITHYQSSKSENNLSQVLRHVEVLLGGLELPTIHRLFNSRNILGSECISCMVRILSDTSADTHLHSKVIELLSVISGVSDICRQLQESFSLSSVLCIYIVRHCSLDHFRHIIPQFMSLLSKITYGRPVASAITHLDQLMMFIFAELEKGESDSILPCLRVLNNLVVNNISIQIHVKSLMNPKRTKNFMQFLKQGVTKYSILALSILTCVFWGDDIAKKLYRSQNWFKAMKLIFSTLFDNSSVDAQPVAADLCIELLKHEEIAQQIAMYEEENSCTTRLFDLLSDAHPQALSKILEVISAFCRVGYVRSSICQRLLDRNFKSWKILLNVACDASYDLTMPMEGSPSLLALDLVKEVCEEVIESAKEPSFWLEHLFPAINTHLTQPFHSDPSQLKFPLLKILKSLQILLCLSSDDDELMQKVALNINCDTLKAILEHQLTHNLTGIVSAQPEWSEIGVDVVLSTLELMLKIKNLVKGMEIAMYNALQENRMVPFFVAAFSSSKSSKVQCALTLHQEASALPDFPAILLGEKMAEMNNRRENATPNGSPGPSQKNVHVSPLGENSKFIQSNLERPTTIWHDMHRGNVLDNISVASVSSSSSTEDKENLDILIDKMHGKLQVGSKTSQIMEMYEQKISSLQTKEIHLQDLLDAKALALGQADRVIAQNRCQRAQSEEEARRLARLLHESELKCEHLLQEINKVETSRQEVEKELECTVEENQNLQKIAEQYDSLQSAFNDKKYRIEVQERNLSALTQEYDTLKELHDMIQKHNEKLKVQHNEAVQRLEELEAERLKLLKDNGDKQMQIHEFESLVVEHEKVARELLDEKSELEVTVKNLSTTIQNLEEETKSLKIKVSSQERTKQQVEHQLKERGSEIKRLHQRNEAQEKKFSSLYNEKENLIHEIAGKSDEIRRLHDKLAEQKQTFLKITELSASLQNSQ